MGFVLEEAPTWELRSSVADGDHVIDSVRRGRRANVALRVVAEAIM
jgi:hypothetical protein